MGLRSGEQAGRKRGSAPRASMAARANRTAPNTKVAPGPSLPALGLVTAASVPCFSGLCTSGGPFAAFAPGAARSTPPPSRGTPYGGGATPGYMAQNPNTTAQRQNNFSPAQGSPTAAPRPQPSFTSRMTDQSGNPTTPQQYYPQLANMVGQFQRGFASAPGGTFTGRGAPQANFQRPPQFNVQQMWADARPSSRSAPGGMTPRALPQGWMY
jgi:hypothetical protein